MIDRGCDKKRMKKTYFKLELKTTNKKASGLKRKSRACKWERKHGAR